jgi:hypothetical protein
MVGLPAGAGWKPAQPGSMHHRIETYTYKVRSLETFELDYQEVLLFER